jgi:tetratricopeptide (TPR) repeat protein
VSEQSDSGKRWAEVYLETMLEEYAADSARVKWILYRMATLRESGQDFEKAAEILQRVLEMPDVDPLEYAVTARRLSHLQVRQRNLEAAEEVLLGCLGQEINNAVRSECLYDLAHVSSLSSKYRAGRNFLDQILDMDDAAPDIKIMTEFMIADMLEQEGKLSEALQAFEAIRDRYPNPLVVTTRVGLIQKQLKGKK